MRIARVALLALTFAAAGCGGGAAASGPAPVPPPNAPSATTTLSLAIPNRPGTAHARTPRYLPGTMAIAFYDGSTLLYVGNVEFVLAPADAGHAVREVRHQHRHAGRLREGDADVHVHAVGDDDGRPAHVRHHRLRRFAGRRRAAGSRPPIRVGHRHAADVHRSHPLRRRGRGHARRRREPRANDDAVGVADIAQWFGGQTASFNQTATIGYEIEDAAFRSDRAARQRLRQRPDHDHSVTDRHPHVHGDLADDAAGDQWLADVRRHVHVGKRRRRDVHGQRRNAPNTVYQSGLTYNSSNYSNGTLSTRTFRCFGS